MATRSAHTAFGEGFERSAVANNQLLRPFVYPQDLNLLKRVKCEHGQQRSRCKECGGASICQHGRRRSECKECASVFIGRTVAKQTIGHGVCEGTVVSFASHGSKYSIEYTDGTTAALTKTALTKILSPVSVPQILATNVATAGATTVWRSITEL